MSVPPSIDPIYIILRSQLGWLNERWATYCDLFGVTRRRVSFLNAAAPSFFFVVQEALFDDIILSICRLALDPMKTGHGKGAQENLNLARLIHEVEATGNCMLAADLIAALAKVKRAAAQLRTYRDKHLAHCDFHVATRTAELAGPSRKRVEHALIRIERLLDMIAAHYGEHPTMYLQTVTHGGSDTLMGLIKAGLRYYTLVDEEVIPATDDPRGVWGDA